MRLCGTGPTTGPSGMSGQAAASTVYSAVPSQTSCATWQLYRMVTESPTSEARRANPCE